MKSTIAFVLLLLVTTLSAQNEAESRLNMRTRWNKGDSFTINRVKERIQVFGGRNVPASRARSVVQLDVLETSKDGSKIAWTIKKTESQVAGSDEIRAVISQLSALTRNVRCVFKLDAQGIPQSLDNKNEVIEFYKKASGKLDAWMVEQKTTEQVRQSIVNSLRPFYDAKSVEAMTLRDPQIFFVRFKPLALGKIRESEVSLPNPFDPTGQNPFPANESIAFVESKNGIALIEFKKILDGPKATKLIRSMIEQQAIAAGQPIPDTKDIPALDLKDETRIRFEEKVGIPFELVNVRTKMSGGNGQLDRTYFTRGKIKPFAKPQSKPTTRPEKK